MHDREKIIKGLEETEIMLSQAVDRGGSMSVMGAFNCLNRVTDTLALLKEQEPKAVKIKKNAYNHEFYYCPRCDRGFEDFFRKPMFCDKCGQAVKWDD